MGLCQKLSKISTAKIKSPKCDACTMRSLRGSLVSPCDSDACAMRFPLPLSIV